MKLVQGVPAKTATTPKVSFLVDTIAAVWPNNLNFRNSSDLHPILRALDGFENFSITVIEIEGWAGPCCWTVGVNSASFKHFKCWKLYILMAKGIRQGHSYCHNESCCRVHLALGVRSLLLFLDWERWANAACVCFKRPRRTSFAHNGGLLLLEGDFSACVRTRRDGNSELGLMWSGHCSFVTYTVQYIKLDKICAILFDAGHSCNKCLMTRFSS